MLKTLVALSIAVSSMAAYAGDSPTLRMTPMLGQQQQSESTSQSDAVNAGNNQTIIFQSEGADTATINANTARDVARINSEAKIRNTPSVSAPPLTSSNDTCMGSSSGSINAPGIGLSLGSTWVDENCKLLKNSRELWNMGMKAASLALMCNDVANRTALELTGFECPQTTARKNADSARPAAILDGRDTGYTGNDPIIRSRLGLD